MHLLSSLLHSSNTVFSSYILTSGSFLQSHPPIGTISEQDKPHNICSVLLIVAMARSWETVAREEEEKDATSDRKKQNKGKIYIL